MIRPAILSLAFAGAALAGCGGSSVDVAEVAAEATSTTSGDTRSHTVPAPRRLATRRHGRTVRTVRSEFGTILADARGQAFYVFDRETSPTPRCYGECARAWPPVLTRGRPVAAEGVPARRLGSVRRRSGKRQVTIDARPLYYYVGDAPGMVRCQNVDEFGGLWLVVRPDGTPVR